MPNRPSLKDRFRGAFGTIFKAVPEQEFDIPDLADETLIEDDESFSEAARAERRPKAPQPEGDGDGGWGGGDYGGGGGDLIEGGLIEAEQEDGSDRKNNGGDTGETDPNDDGSAAYAKSISDAQNALFGATGLTNQMANTRSGTEKDEFYNPTQNPEPSASAPAPAKDQSIPPEDAPPVGAPSADKLFSDAFGDMVKPSDEDPFTLMPKPPSHDTGSDGTNNPDEEYVVSSRTNTV